MGLLNRNKGKLKAPPGFNPKTPFTEQHPMLGERIPLPLEPLMAEEIDPRNVEADRLSEVTNKLSEKRYKQVTAELEESLNLLQSSGFYAMKQKWKFLDSKIRDLEIEVHELGETDPGRTETLTAEIQRLTIDRDKMRPVIAELLPLTRHAAHLRDLLNLHVHAVLTEQRMTELKETMEEEAQEFARRIIMRLSQLDFKHSYRKGNKWVTDRVQFDYVVIRPDAIYLKIKSGHYTLFGGWKPDLPQNVRVLDIVDESVLAELSVVCERQVTAGQNKETGQWWYVIHRLGNVDGLPQYVRYPDVLNRYDEIHHDLLPVPVGVDGGKMIKWVNLNDITHMLIGGESGGGKSNMINVLLSTLIQKHSPERLRLVLIDLKDGLEFQYYENIPHLLVPMADELEKVHAVLSQLEKLRKERSLQIREAGFKDYKEYNRNMETPLAKIVVVIDEYADVIASGDLRSQIELYMMQLLNKGRAAGIQIIICTQHPSVEVISGRLKTNLPVRIATRMPTEQSSIVVLGRGDAAKLADVPGRVVLKMGADLFAIQTPFISTDDIKRAVKKAMQFVDELAIDRAPAVALPMPEPEPAVTFTEEDLIAVSIENCQGKLAYFPIFDAIKETGIAKREEVRRMVDGIIATRKEVEYNGLIYEIKRVGKVMMLVPREPIEGESEQPTELTLSDDESALSEPVANVG